MKKTVTIDCFPEAAAKYTTGWAVVAVDVIRATTMAITAAYQGRRCIPVATLPDAFRLAAQLADPLLAGELKGDMPVGFHMNNSPAELAERTDISRPLVMLSSSGTKLVCNAKNSDAVYLACFRNLSVVAPYLASRHGRVAVIGAGSRGEFREEDQMCCAWIARDLMQLGYAPANGTVQEVVERWRSASPGAAAGGKSADYLRRTNQVKDLDFILAAIDDIKSVFAMDGQDVIRVTPSVVCGNDRSIASTTASNLGTHGINILPANA